MGESILEAAAENRAALVVLGSRGMGAVKRCAGSVPVL